LDRQHQGHVASWELVGAVNQDPAAYPYELYDVRKDWTQFENVAARYPDKVKELDHLFWIEANKYQVLPLDATVGTRLIAPRPSLAAGRTEFTWSGEITGTPNGDAPSILMRPTTSRPRLKFPRPANLGSE